MEGRSGSERPSRQACQALAVAPGDGWNAIEVAVGVAGLFMGTYSGSRLAQVARHRADDRKWLHETGLPAISSLPPLDGRFLAAVAAYDEAVSAIDRRVDVLPWTDRYLWKQVRAVVPAAQAKVLSASAIMLSEAGMQPADAEVRTLAEDLRAAWTAKDRTVFVERRDDFVRYLSQRLRPSPIRRAAAGWRTARAVLDGPWSV